MAHDFHRPLVLIAGAAGVDKILEIEFFFIILNFFFSIYPKKKASDGHMAASWTNSDPSVRN